MWKHNLLCGDNYNCESTQKVGLHIQCISCFLGAGGGAGAGGGGGGGGENTIKLKLLKTTFPIFVMNSAIY